jgi:hypothetical protein
MGPEVESQPVQPPNRDSKSGAAVSVIAVPVLNQAEQVPPQLIPAGLDVTVPEPRPNGPLVLVTLSVAVTVNGPRWPRPAGVVTPSGPVVAPAGTVA